MYFLRCFLCRARIAFDYTGFSEPVAEFKDPELTVIAHLRCAEQDTLPCWEPVSKPQYAFGGSPI